MAASVSGKQILAKNFVLNVNGSFLMPRLSSEHTFSVVIAINTATKNTSYNGGNSADLEILPKCYIKNF